MIQNNTLKFKMVIGGILAVLVPFVITGVIIYIQLSGNLMAMAQKRAIHTSNDTSLVIETFLEANLRLVLSIAADPDIIHALKTGSYNTAEEELKAIYNRMNWEKTTIILTDKNGISKVDTRFNQKGLDLSDRMYFIKAKQGEANISDPIFAKGNDDYQTIIVLCAPVEDSHKFLGMVGMIFTTRFLVENMSKATTEESGYPYLINKDGLILAHPRHEFVLTLNLFNLPATRQIKQMVNSGRSGVASYTFEGIKQIAGISQVKQTGWTVAYTQTMDEIMAPVNKLLGYIFISGVIFLLITIFIIFVVFTRISSPIQQMMDMVGQVTRHSKEVILQIGLDRKIFFANPAFEKLTGIKIKEALGTEPSLDNTGKIPSQTIWKGLKAGRPWSGQLEFKTGDPGNIIILDAMIVPIRDGNGRIQGYLEIGRDVTDELQFEKRMNQAQKLEAIGTLAGGIAHDFNNILSIIFGYAELSLLGKDMDPHVEKNIRQVILASERARELVTQILSFSRQEEMELIPVKLGTIIKEALKLLHASTPAYITIKSDIISSSSVLADPTKVHQVVMNLFTNAVHAIGDKPGTITLTLEDFMVNQEFTKTHPGIDEGKHLLLRLSDTGCGMSQETLDRIFEPFFTTKPQKKGTGLGLSVVHGIVKKMSGIITVNSRPGKGSIFDVVLPAVKDDPPGLGIISTAVKHGTERIVLIDDEINIAAAIQSILINLDYRVTAYTSSLEAMSAIKAAPDKFDLIITDYTMPNLTGLDMVKKLRAADIDLPVVLMSGFFGKNLETAAKEAGISQLLYKPANTHQLSKSIRKALEKQVLRA